MLIVHCEFQVVNKLFKLICLEIISAITFAKNNCMAIKILVTGGTFDKEYDELTGKLFFKDTHLNEILSRGRSQLKVTVETLMMIDSLEMNETHRELILNSCKESEEYQIVITHGTDTMEVTAKF